MAKVLLVEDSATQAVEMRMLLEEAHHHVIHVGDGRQALEALATHPIEIVVTDLEMPVMNGLELVEAMQVDFEHIPSVLVTAKGSEELASKALQRGAGRLRSQAAFADLAERYDRGCPRRRSHGCEFRETDRDASKKCVRV